MRRSIPVALVLLGIIPAAASAATKPAPVIGAQLAVTAVQAADGQNYPLYGGEVFFSVELTHGQSYPGYRTVRNGPDNEGPVALRVKARVGDTLEVCPKDSLLSFGRSKCKTHTFVRADTRRAYVFRFRLTWVEPLPRPDTAKAEIYSG